MACPELDLQHPALNAAFWPAHGKKGVLIWKAQSVVSIALPLPGLHMEKKGPSHGNHSRSFPSNASGRAYLDFRRDYLDPINPLTLGRKSPPAASQEVDFRRGWVPGAYSLMWSSMRLTPSRSSIDSSECTEATAKEPRSRSARSAMNRITSLNAIRLHAVIQTKVHCRLRHRH